MVWSLLYAHRHRSTLGAASHIILTPANQLMVMGLKIWSLTVQCGYRTRDLSITDPTRLSTALTGPAKECTLELIVRSRLNIRM
jgi:hypothetical protein